MAAGAQREGDVVLATPAQCLGDTLRRGAMDDRFGCHAVEPLVVERGQPREIGGTGARDDLAVGAIEAPREVIERQRGGGLCAASDRREGSVAAEQQATRALEEIPA